MAPFTRDRLPGSLDLLILKTHAVRGPAHGYAGRQRARLVRGVAAVLGAEG
ncbi:MAG: hypothetical protein ACRD1C_01540 [Terriglobales bacterium]